MGDQEHISKLLQAWRDGDKSALARLMPIVYSELRKLARSQMAKERPGHTLQSTALIGEAYLKFADSRQPDFINRKDFFVAASKIMREILIDHARKKRSKKRGGDMRPVPWDEFMSMPVGVPAAPDVIDLDRALARLGEIDKRKVEVIELWYFAGMTVEEIAELLKLGTATVNRDLDFAKTWLAREMASKKKGQR